MGSKEWVIEVTKQASPTEASKYNGGPANAAENAQREWPSFAIAKSATKSPTLLAHPRNVKPITALLTFQNVPKINSETDYKIISRVHVTYQIYMLRNS